MERKEESVRKKGMKRKQKKDDKQREKRVFKCGRIRNIQ